MLSTVDLTLTLSPEEYEASLVKYQVALFRLAYQVYVQQRPVVIVFEGWDAAGKGGAIRRVTEKLDPRGFVVYSIAAPKGDEATHHYLWRFWTRLPEDRSDRHLRPQLVRAGHGRADRGFLQRGGMEARLP